MLMQGRPVTQLLSLSTLRMGMSSLSTEVVKGLNIMKNGTDPPLRPDEELPEWLWALAEPDKTLNELKRMKEEDITPELLERLVKVQNRDDIRTLNESRAK